jgi:DNA gyrase subunit A
MNISDLRIMGRATQGVRLINLEKRNDVIASVCKVDSEEDEIKNIDLEDGLNIDITLEDEGNEEIESID